MAFRASQVWDFIDARQIDKHCLSVVILWGTVEITRWAMHFATLNAVASERMPGADMALILASVIGPYSMLQGAAIKFYFDSRPKE